MKRISVSDTIQILSNIGVLAGIVFLGYEIHQTTVTIRLAAADSQAASFYQLDMQVATSPQLARLMVQTDSGPALTPGENIQVSEFALALARTWEQAQYQYLSGALDENLWLGERALMKRSIGVWKYMQAYLKANEAFFTPEFNAEVQTIMQELNTN